MREAFAREALWEEAQAGEAADENGGRVLFYF